VRAFLKERNVDWPNATSDSVKDLVEKRLRINAFPTLILLDREGRVFDLNRGELGSSLMTTIARIVGKR
jgi:hypothetical protein